MKRLGWGAVLLVVCLACAGGNGERFIGDWKSINSGDRLSISREGAKYVLREHGAALATCDLAAGALKCGGRIGDIVLLESSGHIVWIGLEMARESGGQQRGANPAASSNVSPSVITSLMERSDVLHLPTTAGILISKIGPYKRYEHDGLAPAYIWDLPSGLELKAEVPFSNAGYADKASDNDKIDFVTLTSPSGKVIGNLLYNFVLHRSTSIEIQKRFYPNQTATKMSGGVVKIYENGRMTNFGFDVDGILNSISQTTD